MTIRKFKLCLSLLLLTFSFVKITAEPSSWRKTGTDGTQPLGSFDYVNLFNGHLNFTLPLLEIKGRGKTGITLPLSIGNQTWQRYTHYEPTYTYGGPTTTNVQYCNVHYSYTSASYGNQTFYSNLTPITDCYTGTGYSNGSGAIFMGMAQWHFVFHQESKLTNPGYGPGILYATYQIDNETLQNNISSNTNIANAGSGRLMVNFIMPNGSQQDFIDTQSMGQFKNYSITNGQFTYPTRGTNFTSVDGSSTTFISDNPINDGHSDSPYYEQGVGFSGSSGQQITFLTGYIIDKNGSKYRVENGLVRSIRDVDGNKFSFTYDETQSTSLSFRKLTKVTDSLGREITIQYDVDDNIVSPDGTAYGLRDEINFTGLGGSNKKIIVSKTDLGNALRDGFVLKPVKDLWAEATSSTNIYTKQVVSKIWMPDGKAYKLQYDSFGELAKVILPTGAASEYDYDNGPGISRRVTEKRLYLDSDNSNSLINKTNFGSIYQSNNGSALAATQPVQVDVKDANNNLLSRILHYYIGDPANVVNQNEFTRSHGIEEPLNGREIKTEILNPLTQQVYQRTEFNWQMRVPSQTPICSIYQWCNHTVTEYVPGRDLLLVETKTTLEPNKGGGLVKKTTSINPSSGTVAFDQHNNQTDSWDYDYGVGNAPPFPARHQHTDYLTTNPVNGVNYSAAANGTDYTLSDLHIRGMPIGEKLYTIDAGSGAETLLSQSETRYDEPGYPILTEGSTVNWQDPQNSTRGNPTTARTWFKEENRWLETHSQFDQFGNLRKAWDISGDPNKFVETQYSSAYNYAYPTKVIAPAPNAGSSSDFGSTETSTSEMTYDLTTGLPLSVKNDAGQITKTEYDANMRPWRVYAFNYTAPETQTVYGAPSGGQFTGAQRFVKIRKQIDANNWNEATTWFDGLGRTVKTQTKDSQGDVFAESQYDAMGRAMMTTNPYRAGDTKLWNLTEFDALGRAFRSRAPVANQNPNNPIGDILGTSSFDISTGAGLIGTVAISTDASGRKSRSITNALGQLLRVDEPTATGGAVDTDLGAIGSPTQATSYTYDVYGKMVKVQQGSQYRYFKYDSFGRLIRVRQPEQQINASLDLADAFNTTGQWTAGFGYDVFGNVTTAVDARGVTITNTYDRANRILTRMYSGEAAGQQTPNVYFTYDGKYYGPNNEAYTATGRAKGSLTQVRNGISTSQTTKYDAFGRATEYEQITDGQTYNSKYAYNFAGALVEETYPNGRVVKNEFDSDGDLLRVSGKANQAAAEKTYANSFSSSFTAEGVISQMKLGNGKWETAKYNNRQQVYELGLGNSATDASVWKVNYDYGEIEDDGTLTAAKNTGNIARQTISFAGLAQPFVQTYKYDSLYRLKEAKETSGSNTNWSQSITYDLYGNRLTFAQNTGGVVKNQTPTVVTATNRFVESEGFGYDKNGNIVSDVQDSQARNFTFNGENKQTEIRDPGITVNSGNPDANLIGRYFYDGEGRRVKKVTSLETTIFVYSSGKLIAEYSTLPPPTNPSTNYTTTDHLGSPRIITDQLGAVKSRRDFMPFGEDLYAGVGGRTSDTSQRYATTQDDIRQKFTGYQKDKETNLDFAEARMYNNSHARFTAVDPLLASGKSANPQTFNRYIYCSNNPISCVDPTGMDGVWGYRTYSENGGREYQHFNSEDEMREFNKSNGTELCTQNPGSCPDYQVWTGGNWVLWADRTGAQLNDDGTMTRFSGENFSSGEWGQMVSDWYAGKSFDESTTGRLNGAVYDSNKETNGVVNFLLIPSRTYSYYTGTSYDERNEREGIHRMLGSQMGQAVTLELGFRAGSAGRVAGPRSRFGIFHSMYGDGTLVLEGQQPARLSINALDEAAGAYSELRLDAVNGRIYQARTFNSNGQRVLDIDFTVPTFPNGRIRPNHFFREIHPWIPNSGGLQRGSSWSPYTNQ